MTLWRRTGQQLKVGVGLILAVRQYFQGALFPYPSPFPLLPLGDDLRRVQLSPAVGSPPGPPGDLEDDEGLKRLQQVVCRRHPDSPGVGGGQGDSSAPWP